MEFDTRGEEVMSLFPFTNSFQKSWLMRVQSSRVWVREKWRTLTLRCGFVRNRGHDDFNNNKSKKKLLKIGRENIRYVMYEDKSDTFCKYFVPVEFPFISRSSHSKRIRQFQYKKLSFMSSLTVLWNFFLMFDVCFCG